MSNRGTERPPSYEELRRDNDSLRAQNEELRRVLRLLGLSVSAGGLAQALARVARKLSCGNKTDAGRRTWQILSSPATTCSQRMHPFTHLVAAAMPLFAPVPSLPAVKG